MHRIILVRNGEYKSTLYRCKTRQAAFIKFRKIREENENKIMFPKRYIAYKKIVPVEYKIYCVKDTEEGDEFRKIKLNEDSFKYEKPIFGIWTILDDASYNMEEKFWIYGHDPKAKRFTIEEVVKLLMKNIGNFRVTKQVIVVNNKLIIYNEDQFDMVICKNKRDAQRLHHTLAEIIVVKKRIRNLIFMGTATKASISRLYDIIEEKTNWPRHKIHRKHTLH